jgi:hypothetical protein
MTGKRCVLCRGSGLTVWRKAPKNVREKGAEFERTVVAHAMAQGFPGAHRSAPMQAGHEKKYPDVSGIGMWWVECKHERSVPVGRYAKVYLQERPGFTPVLAHRDTGGMPLVTMELGDALKLERCRVELVEAKQQAAYWRELYEAVKP